MKIQSGRIQQVGINPGNGLSLGFAGLGACTNGYDEYGVACQDWSGLTPPAPTDSGVEAPTFSSIQPLKLPGGAYMVGPNGGYVYPTSSATSSLSSYMPLALGGLALIVLMKMAK